MGIRTEPTLARYWRNDPPPASRPSTLASPSRRVASVDFSVRIWDATSGTFLHKLDDHKAVVISAVFSLDAKWVASCGADYKAKIWDADTGALKHSLDMHTGVVWSAAFSPNSRRLITGSDDMTSRIWRVETGEKLVILHEH